MNNDKEVVSPLGGPALGITHILQIVPNQFEYNVLKSLRQIIRAVEIHSRKLEHDFQITGPQLSCLLVIREHGPITVTHLAERVFLSPGTVVGILDRLEEKDLVRRLRSKKDRRLVESCITESGEKLIGRTPPLMQQALSAALKKMPENEGVSIAVALEKLVHLMSLGEFAENKDLSPGKDPLSRG